MSYFEQLTMEQLIDEGNRCGTLAGLRECWDELLRRIKIEAKPFPERPYIELQKFLTKCRKTSLNAMETQAAREWRAGNISDDEFLDRLEA